ETLKSYGIDVPTDWFPNGVDNEYFSPGDEPYDSDTICFVGRMDYYPNQQAMLDFCANVFPAIRAARPTVKLLIVGANPSSPVKKLGDIPGVVITGSVPDVRPYLRRSALMVAPLKIARGTQNKILEAMATGIPVVTTSVAAGGVDATAPEHFVVADTYAHQVAAVLNILENRYERDRLAVSGRARMLFRHNWPGSMRQLDAVIQRSVTEFRATPRTARESQNEADTMTWSD